MQNDAGVTLHVTDAQGSGQTFTGDCLAGCDGASSAVRRALLLPDRYVAACVPVEKLGQGGEAITTLIRQTHTPFVPA